MQSVMHLTSELQKIEGSFILASHYDPTTLYLNDTVFDRDAFKKLKKEGYLELSFENSQIKRYILSSKGKQLLKAA
jgi:hypothetical protein